MNFITFDVMGSPVPKGRPRFSRKSGRAYTPAKTAAAEQSFLAQALPHKPDTPLEGALKVSLGFVMPIPTSKPKKWKAQALAGEVMPTKRPDVDNLAKIVDALNGVFWKDDSQIVEMTALKTYGNIPMTRVRIEEVRP